MKAHVLADHLAENPVDDEYESLNTYFPDEEVNLVEEVVQDNSQIWKLYFDGVVNIKGIGIGTIIVSPTGQHYPATARLCFFYTNNTAEYKACIMDLNMAINLNVHELLVMGDLDLLIRQAQGDWETRDIKLIPYRQCVEDLSKRFKSIEFMYIHRFHNELADALATLASMLPYPGNTHIDPLEIQIRYQHGYCNTIEAEPDGAPWYRDIKQFLKTREYSEHANRDQKRTIRRLSNVGAIPYLLVYGTEAVIPAKIEIPSLRIIVEAGIEDTEWVKSRLEQLNLIDEKRLAAVCFEDQEDFVHSNIIWHLEAITLKAVTKKAVVDFVHSNIICRFSIPKTIITDNAANLNSYLMKEVFLQSTDLMCKNKIPSLARESETFDLNTSRTSFDVMHAET
ncbi:uncharacterized protein LOC142169039 [Nicotiana tabacum]|uniref:Uncharacterized protein LOC142169039 n=1 Tax=Nicotiana tabacum TaxID=4097 RepID=A0AC58SMY2_TOBAC